MTKLDIYQQQVVETNKDILVIAGPGSGKTTTIIEKVNYLLKSCNKEDILLISFTNKSVDDIKKRLSESIYVTTFHKLAIDILKYNKIPYQICPDNMLDYIIDEAFISLNNKDKQKICIYLGIPKLDIKTNEYISFKRLIVTFINMFKTNNTSINRLKNIIDKSNDKLLIFLILQIFNKYEKEKSSQNMLDFDDLIIKATNVLKSKYNYKKYKYIIVDEFQDTSFIRLNLLLQIYNGSSSIITAVGDDAQSIFHFSGCDLNIFLNFQKHFINSTTLFLKNTYRNSQKLINISEGFINKNPYQIVKNMKSNINNDSLELVYYYNPVHRFKKLLESLNDNTMIISRNKNDIYEYIDDSFILDSNILKYKNKDYKYLTIHSSKGLEEDNVIILNVSDKINGLPNKIENHQIINMLSEVDNFPYSEERRVFFVAITRCKKKVYLMIPISNPSIFVKEIKKLL